MAQNNKNLIEIIPAVGGVVVIVHEQLQHDLADSIGPLMGSITNMFGADPTIAKIESEINKEKRMNSPMELNKNIFVFKDALDAIAFVAEKLNQTN